MRPDQHKKKKNAEYKKKHGIPNNAKKKDKETGGHSKRTSTSDETESTQLKPRNERTHESSSDSDEDRQDEEERDHGASYFSRRKIESNLDRYKELDVLDVSPTVSKIGADFQSLLLHKTAGSSSHFLLQDEKEWGNIDENEADSKVGSTLMSIDFKALAEALAEIPLDRRLEIDKKYLEDEPLSVKTTSPAADRCVTAKDNAVSDNSVKQTFTARNFNFSKPSELSQKTKLKSKESEPMNNDKIALTGTTEKIQPGTNHVKKPARNCMTDEEDLEQLLGLTTPERNSDVEVTGIIPQNKECIQDTTRRNIDKVLQPKASQETKEDLEDWLDSVLD